MTVQLTIIGLGQIGTSVGLALANQKELIKRVGHDRNPSAARQAEKMGALDKVVGNLPASVRDADMVLLSLPLDQIHETLEIIAPDLKEGAVVMDTSPVKEAVSAWAGELLPDGRHYVGLTPVINAVYLHETGSGVSAAHADLFKGGLVAVVAPSRTGSEAIKLASDLVSLLGANPLFADPLEIDGLMASMHLLPQLMAAALLNATVDKPGWRDAVKVAGRPYAIATGPIVHFGDAEALQSSALHNRQNVVRVLDGVISALQVLRNDINSQEGEALLNRLEQARQGREQWWKQRQEVGWSGREGVPSAELPKSSDFLGHMIGIRRTTKPKK